jgi:L-ribulose-5-phosphate 3-epimerase
MLSALPNSRNARRPRKFFVSRRCQKQPLNDFSERKGTVPMRTTIDRRQFLMTTGAAAAGLSLSAFSNSTLLADDSGPLDKLGWQLACQLYTFRRFSLYEALDMIGQLGVRYVEPCFFLRLDKNRPQLKTNADLSPEVRKELKQRLADHGIQMINFYASLGADASAARKTFEFAKEMGVKSIVAEPPAGAFDLLEKLCDEYEINLAIHNHPKRADKPEYKNWKPENVAALCEGRSKRIGACCDTGHWVRSGLKPVDCLKIMEGRMISIHLKDVGEWDKPAARDVPLGTGLADYSAVLAELKRQGFRGVLSLEYEHDSPQLMDEVTECLDFVKKTASSLAG